MTRPLIPPYLTARARVAVVMARRIADAEKRGNSPLVAELEALRDAVLEAIDPVDEHGVDAADDVPFDSIRELDARNQTRGRGDDAEWAVCLLAGHIPVDLAGAIAHGFGGAAAAAGYEAFFRSESGLRVVYARRMPRPREA